MKEYVRRVKQTVEASWVEGDEDDDEADEDAEDAEDAPEGEGEGAMEVEQRA